MTPRFPWAVVATLLAASPATCDAQGREPSEILRTLETVQDDLGEDPAQRSVREERLKAEFGAAARSGAPMLWSASRNRRALIAFVLRGGAIEPSVMNEAQRQASEMERGLLQGAVASAGRRDADAIRSWQGVDPRRAPPEIGGLLALSLARLVAADRSKALRYLDLARLLSPGSQIEEAALRQQIFLVSDPLDLERFVRLSERYAARYSGTAFYQNFLDRFGATFVRAWAGAANAQRTLLMSALSALSDRQRVDFLLSAAAESLKSGARDACVEAAQRVSDQHDGEATRAQALMFEAAAEIGSDRYAWAIESLRGVRAEALTPEQSVLRDAALSLADRVRAPAENTGPEAQGEPSEAMSSISQRLDLARSMLEGEK